ncbi:unnamed protein product [Symbiodinium sp. CCMP2592]|nr:unnamed protein product [Symbiodinium sp. CCMP2592]
MAQSQWSVKDVCCEMRDCKALLEARQGTSPSSEFLARIKDTIGFKLRSLPQLSAAEALELHKVLGEVDFGEPVAAALSQQIDEKLLQTTEQTTVVSLKQQSLPNMHLFLTAQDWALLEGDGADWWAKQRCIVQRLKKLGVKSLAESTVRSCVSILLSTVTVLPHPDDQHAAVLEFKGCFHSMENVDDLPYLVRFPEQPSGLPPALLQSAYTEAEPPVAKSIARLAYIAKALPVRDTHSSLSANAGKSKKRPPATPQQSPAASTALPVSPSWQRGAGGSNWAASEASNPMQGFMGMCNEMVKCMQSFQAVQLQMNSRQNPSQCFQQQAEHFQPKPKELKAGVAAPSQLSTCNESGQGTTEKLLALPALAPSPAEPTTAEEEARDPEPQGVPGLSPEEQLFESLKAKQAKAKAKSKCSAKPKAKGKVFKRPQAAPSALAGGSKLPKYVPEAPSAVQLSSRRECFVDKHYHKAKNIALKAGVGNGRAYEYARCSALILPAASLSNLNIACEKAPKFCQRFSHRLLQEIEANGLPGLKQRKHIKECTAKQVQQHAAYGPMILSVSTPGAGGSQIELVMTNLFSMLQAFMMECKPWRDMLLSCMAAHGTLTFMLYSDEINPGNPLAIEQNRKFVCFYGSFLELGPILLAKEAAWLPLCCQRSVLVNSLPGGVSQLASCILKSIFRSSVCDPMHTGVVLKDAETGQLHRLRFRLGCFLQDGLAHKQLFSIKGDNGTRCCILCRNILAARAGDLDDLEDFVLSSDVFKEEQLVQNTDADFRRSVETMQSKKLEMTANDFQLWQQATGISYHPEGLIFQDSLKDIVMPISQWLHDWMHCYFQKGIWNTVMHLTMAAIASELDVDFYAQCQQYFQAWTLPKARSESLCGMFSAKRKEANKAAGTFKATASEGLSLYSLFGFMLVQVVAPLVKCSNVIKAYTGLVNVIELIQAIPLDKCNADELRYAISFFLDACLAAGYRGFFHPKFHWQLHMPSQLARFKCMPSCWVHERKHKVAKRFGAPMANTAAFERSLLLEVIGHQMAELKENYVFDTSARLDKACKASQKMKQFLQDYMGRLSDDIQTCARAHLSPAGQCQKADVVLLKHGLVIGEVYFHATFGDRVLSLLSLWEKQTFEACKGCGVFKKQHAPMLVDTADIACALPFCHLKGAMYRVFVPLAYRR